MVHKSIETIDREDGTSVVIGPNGELTVLDEEGRTRAHFFVPYGAILSVKDGEKVPEDHELFEWNPYNIPILATHTGYVKFEDVVPGETLREQLDEITGLRQQVIIENRGERVLSPRILLLSGDGKKDGKPLAEYSLPTGAHLLVREFEDQGRTRRMQVKAGDLLARIPRSIGRTRDITGGLPRVAELFEARRPRDPAVVVEINGIIHFVAGLVRRSRKVIIRADDGQEREYLIPQGKHLSVRDGDRVVAGEALSEGSIDPHDILRIKGVNAVQEYLVNQIQEVYRMQSVRINDRHVEVIVRQMLQKVRIDDPGDTDFLKGEAVDKRRFQEELERMTAEGGEPARSQPLLLGITKASLSTESFVSAAAFQETTRVLTEAAIQGKKDHLLGLKENVIMGHLIPAGTGIDRYRRIVIVDEHGVEIEETQPEEAPVSVLEDAKARSIAFEQKEA